MIVFSENLKIALYEFSHDAADDMHEAGIDGQDVITIADVAIDRSQGDASLELRQHITTHGIEAVRKEATKHVIQW